MNFTNFLIKKGYKVESSTCTPKGRSKTQYSCIIDKKPLEEDIEEIQEHYNVDILKCNFRKGKELTILAKEHVKKTQANTDIVDINLDTITDMLYGIEMTRDEMREKLSMFQNSSYTKGFNAHKNAMKKLFEGIL
jgi:hypothetical protein